MEAEANGLPMPTSWKDLTKPVYKGHVAMPNPNSSGTGFLDVSSWLQMFGEEDGWAFMDGLHENIDHYTHSGSKPCKQAASGEVLSVRAVPLEPTPSRRFDLIMLAYACLVSVFVLGILGVCQYAALIKFWPYDLSLSLKNYQFDLMDGGGWDSYFNSIHMASYTALFGTIIVFVGAYMVEKGRGFNAGRNLFQLLAMMPMAVPGLVLGLAYIFFFNAPNNPLNVIYGTMAVLNMDDAGDIAPAAAMGMMIFYTAATVRVLHYVVSAFLEKSTQKWRIK